jgi:hypothetical protein
LGDFLQSATDTVPVNARCVAILFHHPISSSQSHQFVKAVAHAKCHDTASKGAAQKASRIESITLSATCLAWRISRILPANLAGRRALHAGGVSRLRSGRGRKIEKLLGALPGFAPAAANRQHRPLDRLLCGSLTEFALLPLLT